MSRTDAWMPLYIGDYLADTMHLNAQEHGAYLLLLMHYWRNGPLLDDDKVLAGICRTSKTTWERHIATAVRAFFVHENGRLHQKRMDVEREKAAQISAKRREAGSRGGAEKAARVSNEINTPAVANAKQTPSKRVANEWQKPPHAGARASASPSQLQLPKKDTEANASAEPVGPAPADAPVPDARTSLWREGLPRLQRLTGKPAGSSRTLLGDLVKRAGDDCALVSAALFEAEQARPIEPVPWLIRTIQFRRGDLRPATTDKPSKLAWMTQDDDARGSRFDFDGFAEEIHH